MAIAKSNNKFTPIIASAAIFFGLTSLGLTLGYALIEFKQLERTVVVKGLSEREYPADQVVWPIQYIVVGNDLKDLYEELEKNSNTIRAFLADHGLPDEDVSVGFPAITDKSVHNYGSPSAPEFRYSAANTITVLSSEVAKTREVMRALSSLGKQGIAFTGDAYQMQTEYLYTTLNDVKPDMIEEATQNAREVAEKFANDSRSKLGKIRTATQGQFSISERDTNNPQIKKLRVVSTVEYYLVD